MARIKNLEWRKHKMVFASNDEIDKMLSLIDLREPMGVRDMNMLVIARHTGLRVGELCALNVYDVMASGQVRTSLYVSKQVAKGGIDRVVPLNSAAREAIAQQIAFQRRRGFSVEPGAPLFTTKAHNRIMPRAVQYIVAELRERAEIATPVTPHSFRKNFATRVASASGTLITQRVMGHKRLNTVSIYATPSYEEMAQAVERLAH